MKNNTWLVIFYWISCACIGTAFGFIFDRLLVSIPLAIAWAMLAGIITEGVKRLNKDA